MIPQGSPQIHMNPQKSPGILKSPMNPNFRGRQNFLGILKYSQGDSTNWSFCVYPTHEQTSEKIARYPSGQGYFSERGIISDTEKDSERLQEMLPMPIQSNFYLKSFVLCIFMICRHDHILLHAFVM